MIRQEVAENLPSAHEGFDERDMNAICEVPPFRQRLPPWFYWPTEIYSFGRCYRKWSGWPSGLPIPVYGDHGVAYNATLQSHELESSARVFLSWGRTRTTLLRESFGARFEFLHAPNPWPYFRRSLAASPSTAKAGTIAFFSHSIDGVETHVDLDRYVAELGELPSVMGPVVVCLHMHDVRRGLHLEFLRRGVPVVTAGNTTDIRFVTRFYTIVTQFAFAIGNRPSSDAFYCTELGIPYVRYGSPPVMVNVGDDQNPRGRLRPRDEYGATLWQHVQEAFEPTSLPPVVTSRQVELTEDVLGITAEVGPDEVASVFARELRHLWPRYLKEVGGRRYAGRPRRRSSQPRPG